MQITESSNILRNLLYHEDFAKKVVPFLKPEYFDSAEKEIFSAYFDYFTKFDAVPSHEALHIELSNKQIQEKTFEQINQILFYFKENQQLDNFDWLVETTEKYVKNKALYNAMTKAIALMQGGDKKEKLTIEAIPELISEALSITFDNDLGHDYIDDALERFRRLKNKAAKIPFHLTMFNKITHGGYEFGTLNVVLAGTNVGKTAYMCDMAAQAFLEGKNVLYLTMEDGEDKIGARIDANLLNVSLNQFDILNEDIYLRRVNKIKEKTLGRLKIRQYPPGEASVIHFKHLLRELKQKYNFVPQIIFVDYLGLCASTRYKSVDNIYYYVKAIAEELRGLGIKEHVAIWTGAQLNRSGNSDSDPSLSDIAESFGIAATADFIFVAYTNEALEQMSQVCIKQLKSRYGNRSGEGKRFVVGLDKDRQKFYDVEESGQTLNDSGTKPKESSITEDPFSNTNKIEDTKFKHNNFSEILV